MRLEKSEILLDIAPGRTLAFRERFEDEPLVAMLESVYLIKYAVFLDLRRAIEAVQGFKASASYLNACARLEALHGEYAKAVQNLVQTGVSGARPLLVKEAEWPLLEVWAREANPNLCVNEIWDLIELWKKVYGRREDSRDPLGAERGEDRGHPDGNGAGRGPEPVVSAANEPAREHKGHGPDEHRKAAVEAPI